MKEKSCNDRIIRIPHKKRELIQTSKNLTLYLNQTFICNTLETKWAQILFSSPVEPCSLTFSQFSLTDDSILQEFLISYLPISIKPLTTLSISTFKIFDELVQESKKLSLLHQVQWMPLFFIFKKWKMIGRVLEYLKICNKKQDYLCWMMWFQLFKDGKTQFRCEDQSGYSKLANFFALINSRSWGCYSKAAIMIKTSGLGEIEQVLIEYLGLNSHNSPYNKENLANLVSFISSSFGKLAFIMILTYFLNYNSYNSASMLCIYVKNKYKNDLLQLSEGFLMKLSGKCKKPLVLKSTNNLFEVYHFIRCCIKYSLNTQLSIIKNSFEILTKSLENLNWFHNMFDIKFWEFIMYRNIYMQRCAASCAKQAISYKVSSWQKHQVLNNFIQEISEKEVALNGINENSNMQDEYLNQILMAIKLIKGKGQNFEPLCKVLQNPFRAEGVLVNWHRAYQINKARESLYKYNLSAKDDKLDPLHPLYYYKIFKQYLPGMLRAESAYLCIKVSKLFELLGKDYFGIQLFDCFCILQAKSYARTDIRKSVVKLRKNCEKVKVHHLVKYFLIKFELELMKLVKKKSKKRLSQINSIFLEIFEFGLSSKYKDKCKFYMSQIEILSLN